MNIEILENKYFYLLLLSILLANIKEKMPLIIDAFNLNNLNGNNYLV